MKILLIILGCIALLFVMFKHYWRKDNNHSSLNKVYPKNINSILDQQEELDIIIALHQKFDQKWYHFGFDSLSAAERIFLCIQEVETEVNNGGFIQYYFNSTGDFVQEGPKAFKEIGAEYTASLVLQASSIFPGAKPPRDRDKRHLLLEQFGNENEELINKLDGLFYEYRDNISKLLIEYMRNNKDQII